MKKRKPFDELVELIAYLRSPKGCPWDRKQTHVSLIKYLQEETGEVIAALKRGRWHEIEDELGDLLLQILLHSQIETERGRFDIQDVARAQYLKLKRRHPHVFAGMKIDTAENVLRVWDRIKRKERVLRRQDIERRLARKKR